MMRKTFARVCLLALPAILVTHFVTNVGAEPLLIDFNSTTQDNGPHLQAGYQAYDADHEVATDFVPVSYSAFNTTVTLTPTWPDTTDNRVRQMIDRNTNGPPIGGNDAIYDGTMLDLVTDWIGVDARSGSGGNGTDVPTSLDLTLGGLPAGDYFYRAYHHDTEFMNPQFTISLTDADGTTPIGTFDATGSSPHANNPNPVNPGFGFGPQVLPSTIVIPFRSDGSDVVFRYQVSEVSGNVHESFLLINGIEIHDEPIVLAEPTLVIDRETGDMTFSNKSNGPITMLGYSMTSSAGALDPSGWISIAENYDADSGASVDPDDTWVELTNPASRSDLSEFELGGNGPNDGATIVAGQSFDLGAGAWIRQPTEDVTMMMKLDDGTDRPVIVEFVGNGDLQYVPGDFNLDTFIDEDDYMILRDGLHTDLSALSGAEAYSMGDINGDSANDYTDTILFRTAYDDANGAGAFAAMVASVPEPTSLTLLGLSGVALLFLRRGRTRTGGTSTQGDNRSMRRLNRTFQGITMFSGLVLLCLATRAVAEPLLIDFNSTTQDSGPHPQAGYQSYDAGHEVATDFVPVGYTAFGTTVTLTPTWPDTDDNRVMQMIDRTTSGPPPTGFDANYLGDMLDLVTDWIGADSRPANGGNGTTGPTTLELTLSGLPTGDYYYRAYHHDTEYMNSEFTISLTDADGTASIGTFEMTGSSPRFTNPNPVPGVPGFGPAILSSTVVFPFRSDGNDVVFQYQVTEGANVHESFVGVNAIEIWDEPVPPAVLTLEVNTDTGATRILNTTGREMDINYYEVTSASGSLNPAGWNSLDAQDFDPIGPGVGDNWDEAGGSDEETLSEIYFHGSSNLADQVVLNLGSAFDQAGGQEDIEFRFGLTTAGMLLPGIVEYVTGGALVGDFDGSGTVEQGDLDLVLLNWGQTAPPEWVNQIPAGNIGNTELGQVKTNWGSSIPAAAAQAVPEPASVLLLLFGGVAVLTTRGRRR